MKLFLGLGLFILCPVVFIALVVSGVLGIGLIPALIIVWLCSAAFKRA